MSVSSTHATTFGPRMPSKSDSMRPAISASALKDEGSAFAHLFDSDVHFAKTDHADHTTSSALPSSDESLITTDDIATTTQWLDVKATGRQDSAPRSTLGSNAEALPLLQSEKAGHVARPMDPVVNEGGGEAGHVAAGQPSLSNRSRLAPPSSMLATVYVDEEGAQVVVKDRGTGDFSMDDLASAVRKALGRVGLGLAKLKFNGNTAR